jgi:hypothetical protein
MPTAVSVGMARIRFKLRNLRGLRLRKPVAESWPRTSRNWQSKSFCWGLDGACRNADIDYSGREIPPGGEKKILTQRLTVTGERIELFSVGESMLRRTTVCWGDGLAAVVAL